MIKPGFEEWLPENDTDEEIECPVYCGPNPVLIPGVGWVYGKSDCGQDETADKKCTCTNKELLLHGCRCGGK